MKSISEADITTGTRVFVRCDLDIAMKNGEINETYRLEADVPTLKLIIDKGGIPIIAGHMGRPDGKYVEEFSTKQLKPFFDSELGAERYELLENLRFDPREEENSVEFAKELIEKTKAQIYVNESFTTAHRAHTSTTQLPKLLPAYAGLRLLEEVKVLGGLLKSPKRPLVMIAGGAKLATKKPVIKKLLTIADEVLVGGRIGMEWAEEKPANLHIPVDYVDGFDIGKETINQFAEIVATAKTIIWAGPMGKYEDEKYIVGTELLAEEVIASDAYTVVGGGDIIAALRDLELLDFFGYVSVGGGAMLDFLEKGNLPALEALGYNPK